MKLSQLILLALIVCLAALLRLYKLSDIPPGVNRDEASIGYTAYSLLQTGRDEYGRDVPVSFESFGDWKLPLYIYTTIPFVKIFGLTELAVRLPSALAGISGVLAVYMLAFLLFRSLSLALISAAVLAISPWHIHLSRVESEANIAVALIVVGSIQFVSAIQNKSFKKLLLASILFAATYYTYHGNHIFTTLFVIGLGVIYKKEIVNISRWWVAVGTGLIFIALILSVTLRADSTKISGISIFGDPTVVHYNIELPRLLHASTDSFIARLIHNRVTYGAVAMYQNYLKSYGPQFLFIKGGDNSAHNIDGYGNLHLVEAPLLLIGLYWLVTRRKNNSSKLILWWIAIGAVAAAITKDAPHTNRMFAVVPALAIATAGAIVTVILHIQKRWKIIVTFLIVAGYAVCMVLYLERYFVHFPKSEAANWGYAYKLLTPILYSSENKTKNIIMTHPEKSPYMYILFYSGFSPALYQKEAKRYPISRDGFTDIYGFGRFSFRPIDWSADVIAHNALLVADPAEIPDSLKKTNYQEILLPSGTPIFGIVSLP